MRRSTIGLLLLTALLTGCGLAGEPTMSADNYDRSCSADEECALVYEGNICLCGQPAAISQEALDRWEGVLDRKRGRCQGVAKCEPDFAEAACQSGTCRAVDP